MSTLFIGCDPEVFSVYNKDGKEFAVSPAMLEFKKLIKPLHEDAEFKHPVYIESNEYSWMQDGMAFELTLLRPHSSIKNFHRVIQLALEHLDEYISKIKFDDFNLSVYKKPVVSVEPHLYEPYLEENFKIYQGFIFGCDPDRDAILPDYKCQTMDVRTHPYRYGGGHLHMSGYEEFYFLFIPTIKLLANTVGNFCIMNSPYPELEKQRATTYGMPGRFRLQNYKNDVRGIEYRTPSNSWLSYPVEKMEEMWGWIEKTVYFLKHDKIGIEVINKYMDATIYAIQNSDQSLAKSILEELKSL